MRRLYSLIIISLFLTFSCTVSYKFNGASIDYAKTPTIDIKDFQNQALLVYPPLSQNLNEKIKDVFVRGTKLQLSKNNPSLELEGEITRYDLAPMAVKEDAFASETRLTMEVKIRFRNNVNPAEDKEETFSAYQDFSSSKMLSDVEAELTDALIKEIVDQIFNSTMSNW